MVTLNETPKAKVDGSKFEAQKKAAIAEIKAMLAGRLDKYNEVA